MDMHNLPVALSSPWPTYTFQLHLTKPPPQLQICDYTKTSYEHARAREKRLAAAKGKRRSLARNTVQKHGCPHCQKRKESFPLELPQGSFETALMASDEDLDPPDVHCSIVADSMIAPLEQRERSRLAYPEGLAMSRAEEPRQVDDTIAATTLIYPSVGITLVTHSSVDNGMSHLSRGEEILEGQDSSTRKSEQRSKRLIVRLQISPDKLLTVPSERHEQQKVHRPQLTNRGPGITKQRVVSSLEVARDLPASRSGRKRYRPYHPVEDGY